MNDVLFERRLRNRLRAALDAELGPDTFWAESPAFERIEEHTRRRAARRARPPLRLLGIAALLVVGGAVFGALLAQRPAPPIPSAPCVHEHGAGRYTFDPEQSFLLTSLDLTFGEGWVGCGLAFNGTRNNVPAMMVGVWPLRFVYGDPCNWRTNPGRVISASTVSSAEAAVFTQAQSTYTDIVGEPGPVSVDGYAGRHIRIAVPADVDLSRCDNIGDTQFRFWDALEGGSWWIPAGAAPALIADIYLLDVNGEFVAIQTVHWPDAPAGTEQDLRAIVDSIHFHD